jgi:hypothetical protein
MKIRLFLLPLACLTALLCFSVASRSQTTITFDDLPDSTTGTFIPTGYQGLSWSTFAYTTPTLSTNVAGLTGYYYGTVSPPQRGPQRFWHSCGD